MKDIDLKKLQLDKDDLDASAVAVSLSNESGDDGSFTYSAFGQESSSDDSEDNMIDASYDCTPRDIVKYLDRYVVGQNKAKKKIAIAIRNRWRRNRVPKPLKDDIIPKNILMMGNTGVGKTELARRVAKLAMAPFIKVEATKFTEIGYVGRDVDSIIRDLVDNAVMQIKKEKKRTLYKRAKSTVRNKILDILVGKSGEIEEDTREIFAQKLDENLLDDTEIEIHVKSTQSVVMPSFDIPGMPGSQFGIMNFGDTLNKILGTDKKTKKRKVKIAEAWDIMINEEIEKLFDEDEIVHEALSIVQNNGIVFIDEIDKISARSEVKGEVNREGVQRDLLPLLEGTTVSTKYGVVSTDHILFIASGAFHFAKPSDLLPELQGRLPIRVELNPLDINDMIRILRDTESSLLKQYCALMETENICLRFTDSAIVAIAEAAINVNREVENIGARRLHTIIEAVLEDISFYATDYSDKEFVIDKDYVNKCLESLIKKMDLSQFIL